MYHILFILSSVDEHLGFFHPLVIMTNAAMNIHVQVSVWTCFAFLMGIYLGVEFQGHMVTMFSFLGNCQTLFQTPVPFYIPTSRI